ncbi:MAG: hypothetical protein AB1606_08185 [Nitrospirota bacterium]
MRKILLVLFLVMTCFLWIAGYSKETAMAKTVINDYCPGELSG